MTSNKGKNIKAETLRCKLKDIDENLTKLGNETNLNVILASYTDTQAKIASAENLLKDIWKKYDKLCEKDITSSKILTDDDYLEYINTTEQEINDFENSNLETQIDKFERIRKRLSCCEKYVQSKKMKIIKCDNCTHNEEDSSSTSNKDSKTESS